MKALRQKWRNLGTERPEGQWHSGQKDNSTVDRRELHRMRWEQRPALKTLYITVKNSAFVTVNRKLLEMIPNNVNATRGYYAEQYKSIRER